MDKADRLQTRPLFGIAGWSNSGKTTLIEKLVRHFADRGLRVATIKHTHHKFDIDAPGSDTARHRAKYRPAAFIALLARPP
jgi:molybdopterin-guanine dinucleotide biosynthesis protein B